MLKNKWEACFVLLLLLLHVHIWRIRNYLLDLSVNFSNNLLTIKEAQIWVHSRSSQDVAFLILLFQRERAWDSFSSLRYLIWYWEVLCWWLSGKEPPANAGDTGDTGSILGQEDSLEKETVAHSSILLTSLVVQTIKRMPTMQETWVQSLGW